MELHFLRFNFRRRENLQIIPLLPFLSVLALIFLAIVILSNPPSVIPYYPNFLSFSHSSSSSFSSYCDISKGEWVPDTEEPYYTNNSCSLIEDRQNCMKFGRPNMDFLKWRWKPEGCELPRFDAARFMSLLKDKSLAFIGDSLARNHMQSLMCMLAKVEYPKFINTADKNIKQMYYTNHNFTLYILWSPFLIRVNQSNPIGPDHLGLWDLYLDEPDPLWASQITKFDHVIISGSNWFTRPSMFYEKKQLIGCHGCQVRDVTELSMPFSHKKAFRTILRYIKDIDSFKGKVIVRTVSPSHFENGGWNNGGDCVRTRPTLRNETMFAGLGYDFYMGQVEELREVEREAREKGLGLEFRLLDTIEAMMMRPDAHPSQYGHWANQNVDLPKDCVHWCLPGPIDMWNEMLLHLLSV